MYRVKSLSAATSDLMVAAFSTFFTFDFPHVGFAIALGLVIVASLDEWIYTWAKNMSDAAILSKELNPWRKAAVEPLQPSFKPCSVTGPRGSGSREEVGKDRAMA